MPRNPYARSLRVHRQQIIPDKREKTLRQLYSEAVKEEIPEDLKALLQRML